MIRFAGRRTDGVLLLGLGVTRDNTDRLLAGKPAIFRTDELGPAWAQREVLLFGAPDEASLVARIGEAMGGRVPPLTAQDPSFVPAQDRAEQLVVGWLRDFEGLWPAKPGPDREDAPVRALVYRIAEALRQAMEEERTRQMREARAGRGL